MEPIDHKMNNEGVELSVNCGTCGRDMRVMNPWGELNALIHSMPVAGTKQTLSGVQYKFECHRCQNPIVYEISWEEISAWVPRAQKAGLLPMSQTVQQPVRR